MGVTIMTDEELKETKEVHSDLVVAKEIFPSELTIIPLIQRPVFPGLLIPFTFSGDFYPEKEYDTSFLKPSIYFLRISSEVGTSSKRLIVE
jgi:hypothetical protein